MGWREKLRYVRRRVKEEGPAGFVHAARAACVKALCLPFARQEKQQQEEMDRRWNAWTHAREAACAPRPERFHLTLSFVVPVFNTDRLMLKALLDRMLAQTCGQWEAVLYDACSDRAETRGLLDDYARLDSRLQVIHAQANEGIAQNTNRALAYARGELIALVDHDDTLAPDAVWHVLDAAAGGADLIYSDEDKLSEDGQRYYDPHLKPDFAPDTLRAENYICHLLVLRRELMTAVGGLDPAMDGSQDHDLVLRASELARQIVHIPVVLYHWRQNSRSFSHVQLEKCVRSGVRAVQNQLRRLSLPGNVVMEELHIRILPPENQAPTVSLIVSGNPSPGWIRQMRASAGSPILEIYSDGGDRRAAAGRAHGQVAVFADAGCVPQEKNWLRELCLYALRLNVGCVGGPTMDRMSCYENAGYAFGEDGAILPCYEGGHYYGWTYRFGDRRVHNVSAVSGDLLAIRMDVLEKAGGYPEAEGMAAPALLGLRCLEMGLLNVYTPYAALTRRSGSKPPVQHLPPGCRAEERYRNPQFQQRNGAMLPELPV